MLDQFAYQQSDDECSDKWSAYAWPKKIEQTVQRLAEAMEAKRESLQRDQETDQQAFEKSIAKLEARIGVFNTHDDMNELAEVAHEARDISSRCGGGASRRST